MVHPWELLEVHIDCDRSTLQRALKRKILKCHADKVGQDCGGSTLINAKRIMETGLDLYFANNCNLRDTLNAMLHRDVAIAFKTMKTCNEAGTSVHLTTLLLIWWRATTNTKTKTEFNVTPPCASATPPSYSPPCEEYTASEADHNNLGAASCSPPYGLGAASSLNIVPPCASATSPSYSPPCEEHPASEADRNNLGAASCSPPYWEHTYYAADPNTSAVTTQPANRGEDIVNAEEPVASTSTPLHNYDYNLPCDESPTRRPRSTHMQEPKRRRSTERSHKDTGSSSSKRAKTARRADSSDRDHKGANLDCSNRTQEPQRRRSTDRSHKDTGSSYSKRAKTSRRADSSDRDHKGANLDCSNRTQEPKNRRSTDRCHKDTGSNSSKRIPKRKRSHSSNLDHKGANLDCSNHAQEPKRRRSTDRSHKDTGSSSSKRAKTSRRADSSDRDHKGVNLDCSNRTQEPKRRRSTDRSHKDTGCNSSKRIPEHRRSHSCGCCENVIQKIDVLTKNFDILSKSLEAQFAEFRKFLNTTRSSNSDNAKLRLELATANLHNVELRSQVDELQTHLDESSHMHHSTIIQVCAGTYKINNSLCCKRCNE
ncbi:hypothetical protein Bhyg_06384 [Pseudolycoriella hygida]|uniref:J domain-containing protein n=1 Tax=Pseudolycoriella hygida TaxID=35572 RepID=A0A9Q0S2W3_9DIPT|nr:hypothetical protein Bhyg_06384 [Pseudolycoriella hygida]